MVGGISEKVNFRELSHVITEPIGQQVWKAIHKPDAVFTTISTVLDFLQMVLGRTVRYNHAEKGCVICSTEIYFTMKESKGAFIQCFKSSLSSIDLL